MRFLLVAVLALASSACDRSPTVPFHMDLDMKQVMNLVLEPAADVVWDSAGYIVTIEGETNLAPTDEEGWLRVQAAGGTLVEAGNALMLPGRHDGQADWLEFSAAISATGMQIIAAGEAQDQDAVFQTGATLYSVCVACHQVYAPGL